MNGNLNNPSDWRSVLSAYTRQLPSSLRRVLLVPPDITRIHSGAGPIAALLYGHLTRQGTQVDVLPALGTHVAMTREECKRMFGDVIPFERIHAHRWREDCMKRGLISSDEMSELSGGRFRQGIDITMNRLLFEGVYDLIISIGQVVPHEVVGMAGYTKNICVGLGGPDVIHKSHFLGAVCGIEAIMGVADTPVRQLLNVMFKRCPPSAPVDFILTVVGTLQGSPDVERIVIGRDDAVFREAARLSVERNCVRLDRRIQRAVVYLDPTEYRSTWLGNKAVYRLRKAMADDGTLLIIAPGVDKFGEDPAVDVLIRRHGYRGTAATLEAMERDAELGLALSVPAHLIHGSSEGRFRVVYATGPSIPVDAITGVGYEHMSADDAAMQYPLDHMKPGWNEVGGESVYFVNNPGLGLWVVN